MYLRRTYRYTDDTHFVADLIADDAKAVECLLYGRFRDILVYNALKVSRTYIAGSFRPDVDDLAHELYLYFKKDNWAKLRKYDPSLPFDKWLSVVSYRFFKDHVLSMPDTYRQTAAGTLPDAAQEHIYAQGESHIDMLKMDIRDALDRLDSPRDRSILQALVVDDEEPAAVAAQHNITVENLYNIKHRALARLIRELGFKKN